MKVELIQKTENPIEMIAKIASICYDSDPANPKGLVKHLYRNGHHSVFEHIFFTFKISGISRACSHQLVRYRHCSFTQRSQRYCGEQNFKFVTPPDCDYEYDAAMACANDYYMDLVFKGIPKEDARMVLPNACETELYLSCKLRQLIHMAQERLCTRAQWEIRDVVRAMVDLVDDDLKFMLVPKCQSGYMICQDPCKKEKI